jgi:predicted esterase
MTYLLRNSTVALANSTPVDNLAPLAKTGVKILHLHGDEDTLILPNANSTELARRYGELGGDAEIVLLQGLPAAKRGHDGPNFTNRKCY